jgi:hypothetical protein
MHENPYTPALEVVQRAECMSEPEMSFEETRGEEKSSNPWFDEVCAKPSSLPELTISLSGFAQEDVARALGETIKQILIFYGRFMDLSHLDRVLVTYDYEGALANLERGIETEKTLAPTQDDIAVGIAMTPAIIRDGEAKSVMVLNACHMIVLIHPDNEEIQPYYRRMLYAIAHECGHVHDLATMVRCFPEQWLKLRLGRRDSMLFETAAGCWSEYISSRLSAVASPDEITTDYENIFCEQLGKGMPAIRAFIRQYRMHGNVAQVLKECSYIVNKVLVYASYLLGQLAGLNLDLATGASKATGLLEKYPTIRPLVERLEAELEAMHNTYGAWTNFDIFEPLKRIALDLYQVAGLELEDRGEQGMYVNIPLTGDTVPDLAEQLAFLAKRQN